MKILHLANYYHENFGYQENWLPHYQQRLGNEVLVIASDRYFPFPNYKQTVGDRLGSREVGTGEFVDHDVKILRVKTLFEIPKRGIVVYNFYKNLKEFKPEIIHLHGATNLNIFFVMWYALFSKVKIFIDCHSDFQVVRHNSIFNRIYYFFWKGFYKSFISKKLINHFLPITEESREFLNKCLGVSERDMTINYLGVNLSRFNRKNSNTEDQKLISIVNAGKQYPEKRIDFILNVLEEIVFGYKRVDFRLILIGSRDEDYDLVLAPLMLKLKDFIVEVPFLSNEKLVEYYSKADWGIWPGIPSNTIQEAMACETAVVLPDNKTVNHLVDGNGFLFKEVQGEKEVAKKIVEYSSSKQELSKMKDRSFLVAQKYSWENIAKESLKVYDER